MAWWLAAAAAAKAMEDQKQKQAEDANNEPKASNSAFRPAFKNPALAAPEEQPVQPMQPQVVNPMFQTDDRARQASLMDAIRMGQPPQQQAQPMMSIEDILRQGRGY
jgi:hypothetical protein